MLKPIDADFGRVFAFQAFVKLQNFPHLRADSHMRGQAGQRILENHRHPVTANIAQRLFVGSEHLSAFKHDRACGRAIVSKQS